MIFSAALALTLAPGFSVGKLRTEYLVNPLGIGERVPRFFWVLDSKQNGQRQTAYRVIVGSAPGKADLWDSGKVRSNQTIQIEYKGKPLSSRQRAWWAVQAWDQDGRLAKSPNAFFETGLLNKSDWQAKWVGMPDSSQPQISPENAKWIWYPEGEPQKDAPEGDRRFRTSFEVNDTVTSADLAIAVDDKAEVRLNGKSLGEYTGWTNFAVVTGFKENLQRGKNELEIRAFNERSRAGLLVAGQIVMGPTDPRMKRPSRLLSIVSNSSWEAQIPAPVERPLPSWVPARELAPFGGAPYGATKFEAAPQPAPMMRRQFSVHGGVRRARVYASARGLYELYVDGKKVSRDVFRPGWTDYKKRIQYQTYDVTSRLAVGDHAIGLIVGDGWYCGNVAWAGRQNYGPKPMGLAQLEIEYDDGSRETVATDASWAGLSRLPGHQESGGPIRSNDLLMGESYDARLEDENWASPWGSNVRVGGYTNVVEEPLGNVPLVWQPNEPVRELDVLSAKTMTEPKPGTFVFDLGQNMVGFARLKVRGPAGSTVTIRYAEMLNPDGTLYTTNLRRAKATDTYTLKGGSLETWQPRFTFHGFRYVELTGFPVRPTLESVKGVVIGSAMPQTGWFTTSNSMINQLQHNIFWGQRSNYLEVPTDCPQRDERLGWMGDAQIFVRTATFNNDIAAFMTKWTQDVEDGQSADGSFADVSPRIGVGPDGSPAWGDAGVIVPWTIYQQYGDKRLLARRYESMKRWVDFIDKNNPDHIWIKRSGANYGDWLNVQDDTPRDVVATAFFAHSTRLLHESAKVLGKAEDAKKYGDLFIAIRNTFQKQFIAPDGRIKGDTQTAYLLAVGFGLVDIGGDQMRAARTRLRELIVDKRDTHLSTGFLGCGYLNPVLSQLGMTQLAYKLLLTETYPSWLYPVKNGATTIWERWDGWTDTKGFQDPGMNSFNHYSFGAVGEWMYSKVGGLAVTPNERFAFRMQPEVGPGINSALTKYESIFGTAQTYWKRSGSDFTFTVHIPANTKAYVLIPAAIGTTPTIDGKPLDKNVVSHTTKVGDTASFVIGSGTYTFRSQLPNGV
jgi:alpha-L-rhamnosidase